MMITSTNRITIEMHQITVTAACRMLYTTVERSVGLKPVFKVYGIMMKARAAKNAAMILCTSTAT